MEQSLKVLLENQRGGAFKVDGSSPLSLFGPADLKKVAEMVGWSLQECYLEPIKLIEKADKLLHGFQKIVGGTFVDNCRITMTNYRKSNSIETYDRILLRAGKLELTLLYNTPNATGKYILYNTRESSAIPVKTANRLSEVTKFINENYV